MIRRALLTGFCLAFAPAAAAQAQAEAPRVEAAERAVPGDQHVAADAREGETGTVSGRLLGVRGYVVAVTGTGQAVQLVVKDEAAVQAARDDQAIRFDQLRPGDEVRASYRVEGQTRVLTRIEGTSR